MPIYEYKCSNLAGTHTTEAIRSYRDRDVRSPICHCGYQTFRIEISQPHCMPDGMYSYEPNVGSARDFERRRNALESGQRVIKRTVGDD